jgi:hypothetical protein
MSSHLKIVIVVSGVIVVLLGSWALWRSSQAATRVYFPNGRVAVFVGGEVTNVNWQRFEPPRVVSRSKRLGAQQVGALVRFSVRKLLGQLHFPVPNPPRPVGFLGNIRAFPGYTGKTYLVADELLTGGDTNWISFVFGGPCNSTSFHQWVQMNLDCIRTNGVMRSPLEQPYQPFSTTLCAVVVGPKTVSILPAHHLYRQPGNPSK